MIRTDRLLMRPWTDADRAPFQAMSADPGLMEFLMPLTTREKSDAWIDRQMAHQARHGFCFWALEAEGELVGSVGLMHVPYEEHFTPAVELGWRVARPCWGRGFAPEAARAALDHGFETLALPQLVANASLGNTRSRRVMEKLGMTHDPADDFDHPKLAADDPKRRCALYRISLGGRPGFG